MFAFNLNLGPRIEVYRGLRRPLHVEDGMVHVRRSRSTTYGYSSGDLHFVRRRRRSFVLEPLRPWVPEFVEAEPQIIEVEPAQVVEVEPRDDWRLRWNQSPRAIERAPKEEHVHTHVHHLAPAPAPDPASAPAPAPPPPPAPQGDPSVLGEKVETLAAQNTALEAELRELREQVTGAAVERERARERARERERERERERQWARDRGCNGRCRRGSGRWDSDWGWRSCRCEDLRLQEVRRRRDRETERERARDRERARGVRWAYGF